MNDVEFGPIDPFEAYQRMVKTNGRWGSEDEQEIAILLVGYNKVARHPFRTWLIHCFRKWAMIVEECPDCGQEVDIDAWLWRQSGAELTCNVCSQSQPNTLIASDNKERLNLHNGEVEIPERITQHHAKMNKRRHDRLKGLIARLDAVIEATPDDPWLYVHRGNLTSSLCEFEDPAFVHSLVWLQDFGKAVELAPDDAWIRCWRAIECYSRRKMGDQVIADLERAQTLDPSLNKAREFLDSNRDYICQF